MESERGSISLFDAFSSREPVPTSLENALVAIGSGAVEAVFGRATDGVSTALTLNRFSSTLICKHRPCRKATSLDPSRFMTL
jgi:hypothetical protein